MTSALRILAPAFLCIGLLAFGCGGKVLEQESSAAGGTSGSGAGGTSAGGTAQTGGSSGASGASGATNACNNPSDAEVLQKSFDGGSIRQVAADCWMSCLYDTNNTKECVYSCIKNSTGAKLSPTCTVCFAVQWECLTNSCLAPCAAGPLGGDCELCRCGMDSVHAKCSQQFWECSGIFDCPVY